MAKFQQQVDALKIELAEISKQRDALKAQVEELANTPSLLLSKVVEATSAQKLEIAEMALETIRGKYPQVPETDEAQRLVDALRIKREKQQEEVRRIEALGFKAIKTSTYVDTGEVKVSVGAPSFTKQFIFDRYDDTYHYLDADRDNKYLVLGLKAIASKGVSDPALPGFALYWVDGKVMRRIEKFALKFTRWEDYATYLGNYPDSRNDFAKTSTIPFALGAHGPDDELVKRPLYLVATKEGCLRRQSERFRTPPDFYLDECKALEETLGLEAFSAEQGKVTLIRRID